MNSLTPKSGQKATKSCPISSKSALHSIVSIRVYVPRPISLTRGADIKHRSSNYVVRKSNATFEVRNGITHKTYKRRKKLALLLPAHNEELILPSTIRSAIAAGQRASDIYVVDDNSSDNTRKVAIQMLGSKNVLSLTRSGKAVSVQKGVKHFKIKNHYVWVHIADGDSVFGRDYFRIYKQRLDAKKYAVAVGFVQSMRGNWISTYRAFSYTYGQHVIRRFQASMGMITVFPGPTTSFRTDIFNKLAFDSNSFTEDFDITLQVHRHKLGKILYIPEAINYTQDPQTLHDFIAQTTRWNRGLFQGIVKYRIGSRLKPIDLGLGYQFFQTVFYFMQLFILAPLLAWLTGNWLLIPALISVDFITVGIMTLACATAINRVSLIGVLPFFYFLQWLQLFIYLRSFVEVIVLKRFRNSTSVGWGTENRRYALNNNALQDLVV